MPKLQQGEERLTIIDQDGGELRVVEMSRQDARDLNDKVPPCYEALDEALDECQGAAEEHDSVLVIVIKAGPLP